MTEWLFEAGTSLHAPHLLDIETAQILRRFVRKGEVTPDRARQALEDLVDLPLERYSHELLLPRVWSLRESLTAYDAVYVALAEVLNATLLTRDRRISRAPGHAVRVEVF